MADSNAPGAAPAPPPITSSVPSIGGALASGTTPSLTLARSLTCPPEQLASMPPMDLLISQLSCDSSEARVDAMKRLHTVALAIGPESTLNDLLPFLATGVAMEEGEEDEILLLLAEQLGLMVPDLIPGNRALPMLPILERLAAVEETVVRDKAVESINKIVPVLSSGDDDHGGAPTLLLAMAKRLAGADWFTAKISAAGVLPAFYSYYNRHEASKSTNSDSETRRELRALYKDLSQDDTPMVRRGAARNLGPFVEAVADLKRTASETLRDSDFDHVTPESRRIVTEEMVPMYRALAGDEQDSVRLLASAASGSVGAGLGADPELTAELVLGVVRASCVDLSWRVRHNIAKTYSTVAANTGFANSSNHAPHQTEIFSCFSSLLQDAEAEVRAAAVENIARMAQLGGPDLFQSHVAPSLPSLADDPVMEVRSKLAQALMDCCDDSICTSLSDRVVLQVFKPLLEGFLNDEFAEVQLHILTKLSRVSHLFNKMDVVVSSILQMAKAQNWRVRAAVGNLLPHLAEARGVSFFEDHLLEPWLRLLLDQVADVRSSCVTGMPKLLSVAGAAWIQREVLPHYVRMYDDPASSYLTRITVLRSYAALAIDDAGGNATPALLEEIIGRMLRALDDRVPNVRMVATRGLATASAFCEDAVLNSRIRPALNARVTDDEDEDCKYFAQVALDACA